MSGGGSKPGERRGGRKPGTPNKLPKGERWLDEGALELHSRQRPGARWAGTDGGRAEVRQAQLARLGRRSPTRSSAAPLWRTRVSAPPPSTAHVLERTSVKLAVHEQREVDLTGQRRRTGLLQE